MSKFISNVCSECGVLIPEDGDYINNRYCDQCATHIREIIGGGITNELCKKYGVIKKEIRGIAFDIKEDNYKYFRQAYVNKGEWIVKKKYE